jgi:hypothetical protein
MTGIIRVFFVTGLCNANSAPTFFEKLRQQVVSDAPSDGSPLAHPVHEAFVILSVR